MFGDSSEQASVMEFGLNEEKALQHCTY